LFNYRPVKPIDTIIARALLETVIYVAVYILLMTVVGLAGEQFEITNLLSLACTWFLLVIFSCGIGMIFMVMGKTIPETEKFLPIFIKPLYFISCIMFPLRDSERILAVFAMESSGTCCGIKPFICGCRICKPGR
jgi:capsular polysaccharide transport system permease protein